jgi:hypothetical protein
MPSLRFLVSLLVTLPLAAQVEIHVSPSGRDAASGSARAPVASLERAAELVRAAREVRPAASVTVLLAPGDYPLSASLQLGPADSGTASAPVVWRSTTPGAARIVGAKPVNPDLLRPLSDPALIARLAPEARGHVRELDLDALRVRHSDPLPDWARESVDLFAVFFDDLRLPLSRWPNGEHGYTTMKRVLDSGSFRHRDPRGGTFEYREDRPARWQAALAENGVWVRGFWRVPWTAETIRVKAIDPAARTITLAVATPNGIGSKYSRELNGTRPGDGKEPWFALNLLEEIDEPGEWSVDFTRNKLYLWLPEGPGHLLIADNSNPLLSLMGAEHVHFRDLVFTHNMGEGVSIADGDSVRLLGCRVQNILRRGVVIRGGFNHVVQSCDLTEIGLAAIDLLGGDRATLTHSGHRIVNNHVWRAALLAPVPALIAGLDTRTQQLVGALIAHNRVHDVTYSAIHFAGNENILEFNEFYRLGLDGGDLGGFYTTGGWTSYGNVVRHNFIHHAENANAIYMDDGGSGLLAEDNVIYRAESGIFIGGGHDHLVRRNLVVRSKRAIHVDARGMEPARNYVATDRRLRSDLDSVPFAKAPWSERYPSLLTLLDHDTRIPRGNVLRDNVSVECETFIRRSGKPEQLVGFAFQDNHELPSENIFVDAASLNLVLRDPAHPAFAGLTPFDLSRYGIRTDEYRRSVPERDLEQLRSGDTKRRAFDSNKDVESYRR